MPRTRKYTAVAVAAAALTAAAPANAATGRIAFVSTRDGNTEIYSMKADGTDLRRLTNNTVSDGDPALSPDGTKIAFSRAESESSFQRNIWVMNADGSDQHPLVVDNRSQRYPTWSPDGRSIAYRSNAQSSAGENFEIFVTSATAGGTQTRLTNSPGLDSEPSWSSANEIAFVSERGGTLQLYVMRPDGSGVQPLVPAVTGARYPEWSPDSQQLAFTAPDPVTGRNRISTVPAGGGTPTPLSPATGAYSYPTWSPDGTALAFYRTAGGGATDIAWSPFAAPSIALLTATGHDYQPSWSVTPGAPTPGDGNGGGGGGGTGGSGGGTGGSGGGHGGGGHGKDGPPGVLPRTALRLRLSAPRRQHVRVRKLRIRLQADRSVKVEIRTSLRIRGRQKAIGSSRLVRLQLAAGVRRTMRVRLRASALKRARSGLTRGRRVSLTVTVRAPEEQRSSVRRTVRIVR